MSLTELPTREPDFYIGEGATYPKLEVTLSLKGNVVDVTGDTITFSMMDAFGNTKIAAGSAAIESASDGEVSYTFSTADTNEPGDYYGQFHVDFTGGVEGTFPSAPGHFITIRVIDRIE